MTASMIEARQLSKLYAGRAVVQDVSFTVARGELLVLVGASGSGKTTTLKMINRLIEPSAGKVLIEGRDVAAQPGHLLRRRIGYVFQKIGLFPHMTVEQNIAVPLSLLRWPAERARQRVRDLLELVEIEPALAVRRPAQLSGGEQQRVGVARALASEPELMLLDEPFGALDPLTRDHLQQSLARIRKRLALTAVFVTHDMAEALMLADRIAVMKDGSLLQVGTPRELLAAPSDGYVERLLAAPRRHAQVLDALRAGTER